MKSSRRGFLGLIGGGAVAGPGALKKAMANATASKLASVPTVQEVPVGYSNAVEASGSWRAQEILQLIQPRREASFVPAHECWFADVRALKSVSETAKCQIQMRRRREIELANCLSEFIKEKRLDLVGLTEDSLLSIIKKAAGE